ncbi:MAG: phosphate propanoyltransferase [Candidatus Kerfeldbacteria bacterium]|nr:phosphate propanoyltransferase [Candidatus Kerfeldbacteria bacterium]
MSKREVTIEVSARHVHLSQEHLAKLFGAGSELHLARQISQPGQFAAEEKVTIVGPKGKLACRVVGPLRPATQVELSVTDCRLLGLPVALRVSGTLAGTPGARLEGKAGSVELEQGVIVAQRHLHINPTQARAWGLKHGDVISIKIDGARPVTWHDVFVCSREGVDELSFMIDTDEANAAGLKSGERGAIVD